MDYSPYKRHHIACIDMKSFFASCECVLRGLNPLEEKLAVVSDITQNGSVVLASSPQLKKQYNIYTGSRYFEIQRIPDNSIIVVQARIETYYKIAKQITGIFEDFVPPSAIHIYSIDESWLTFDGTEKIHGNIWEASGKLIDEIKKRTGIPSAVGIGDNKFLAKTALDNFAKQTKIAEVRYEQVKELLHPLSIGNMWGVGKQLEKKFHNMNIFTFGDLANSSCETIKKTFGKVGETLFLYSWGIDESPVIYDKQSPSSVFGFSFNENNTSAKSIGRGVTLKRDYYKENELHDVIKDLIDEVCYELRKIKKLGRTIHLSFEYGKHSPFSGFSRQKTIQNPTNDRKELFEICKTIYQNFHKQGEPVRKVNISIGKLSEEIDDPMIKTETKRRRKLEDTFDTINQRFGKGVIRKASSFQKDSIEKDRVNKMKGHYK